MGMRTSIVCLLLLLLFSSLTLGARTTSSGLTSSAEPHGPSHPAQTPHDAIVITENQDFVDQGWPGEGTASNPYRISGFAIVTSGFGITVANTTSHFAISDCTFSSSSDWNQGGGVQFENVENGRVERCHAYSINSGVEMKQCTNCSVTYSRFDEVHIPLNFYMCPQCKLTDSTIQGTVFLYDCDGCTVRSNIQVSIPGEDLSLGFNMIWCDSCSLVNNTVTGNAFGIWIDCCLDLSLQDNELVNNGIFVEGFEQEHFVVQSSGNQVNGKPLGYFIGAADTTIDGLDYGQVVLASSSNITVAHGDFDNVSVGLLLANAHDCLVTGVSARHNYEGIKLEGCQDCIVSNCSVNENYFGIYISGGSGHVIYWNIICGNGQNALDEGKQNAWDDGERCGNFWDDMTPGAVYLIPGSAGSVDHYPNGTVGTYTITPTESNPWIGNSTIVVVPPELLVPMASAVIIVIVMTVVAMRRRSI